MYLLLCCLLSLSAHAHPSSSKHILQQLLVNYDKTDVPFPGKVDVQVELQVEDIPGISETDGSFGVDIRFTQMWNDPNLSFVHVDSKRANMTLDYSVLNSLWTPNVCFVNSKRTRVHMSPAPNILLMISPNGTVRVTYRVRVEGPCHLDMSNFPMDVQRCRFVFESYSHNAAEVHLQWLAQKAINLATEYSIPEFILVDVKPEQNRVSYATGMWDQLAVRFTFKRKLGYYMLQAYLPTHVCVAVSWVSFYLDTTATPARATVGVSTLMALLLAYGNIASGLPRVSYLRALDIWMTACTLLTFLTLLEFAAVAFIDKRRQKEVDEKKRRPTDLPSRDDTDLKPASPTKLDLASSIDAISAKAFPTVFLLFNATYWMYYLYYYFAL